MEAAQDQLLDGTRAMEHADWEAARVAFEAVLAVEDVPAAHEGLGQALWFLGRCADGIAEREQAFEGHLLAGRLDDAARVAVWVSHQHLLGGRSSAARGWLARAARAAEGTDGPGAGRGWVAVERARHAEGTGEQIAQAELALGMARAAGDADLEVFALSVLGRAVVGAGRREDGLALLEEAMAAADAGRVRSVHTLAEAYCNLIDGCSGAGEWQRAAEWCAHVGEFARANAAAPLSAACRTIHAGVLLATGQWPAAEHALETALETHERYVPTMDGPTVATLAELRVRQGRMGEAERLLAGREERPLSLRASGLLLVAQGRPADAVVLLERGLRGTADHAVRASQLLGPLVDALLACGDVDGAALRAAELAGLGSATGIRFVTARGDLALARVALAGSAPADAVAPAERALGGFAALLMPFEAAEARLDLARALVAGGSPELARDEARTACLTFRSLGAARSQDAASALLRSLGTGTAPRPRRAGQLTAREVEVLELIALGMTNARIAESLVISEKTAGHHVSHILTKLGVHNRAEAVAHAARAASSSDG